MRELNIVINADDLGISCEVNGAIFDLIEQGIVTSSTAVANGPYIVQACTRIQEYPWCSFGAHLNLSEFEPLTTGAIQQLLGSSGGFSEEIIRSIGMDSTLKAAIFDELSAQIERLIHLGLNPDHLDSHHHIHTLPKLFPIFKAIQRRYGIKHVRLSRNIYGPDENIPLVLHLKKKLYNVALKYYVFTKTTQYFTDFNAFYKCIISGKCPEGSVELMVHPGYDNYAVETKLLSEQWKSMVPFPVRLISYQDLK